MFDAKIELDPPHDITTIAKPTTKRRRLILFSLAALLLLIVTVVVFVYYQLQPLNPADQNPRTLTIESGWTPNQIANTLAEQGVIRHPLIFKWYGKLTRQADKMRAGTYQLKASLSIPQLYELLLAGASQNFTVTFYPGAALFWPQNKQDPTPSIAESLRRVGYTETEIAQALATTYQTKLAALLPETNNLEGLIYADSFNFEKGTPIKQVIERSLNHLAEVIKQHQLVERYQKQGLSLYQGIILASIIEREVGPMADHRAVAQVFLNRLRRNMNLGSDVTYQYASRLAGVDNNLNIDSPYNTRRYPGLPPTPIAVPSLKSLLALAQPSGDDYLYFLSGDDDRTYFARTHAEHEANIRQHCQVKCTIE